MRRREPVKLSRDQIDAAQRIHAKLKSWHHVDSALQTLHRCYPGFGYEACLIKVPAVNSLYSTYVLAITRMAQHVHDVMNRQEFRKALTEEAAIALVEAIASLPPSSNSADDLDPDDPPPTKRPKERQFRSFASKFCAFFVDNERFPIYDEAARQAMKHHLPANELHKASTYEAFVRNIRHLRDRYELQSFSFRQLDRYLWLRGMHDRNVKDDPRVNSELREFFRSNPPELKFLLGTKL